MLRRRVLLTSWDGWAGELTDFADAQDRCEADDGTHRSREPDRQAATEEQDVAVWEDAERRSYGRGCCCGLAPSYSAHCNCERPEQRWQLHCVAAGEH